MSDEPTPEQIRRLIAASPDISEAVIQQANEQVDELAALARTWIMNGDDRMGAMLNCLCIAFGYQRLAIQKLLNENANLRARAKDSDDNNDELHPGEVW